MADAPGTGWQPMDTAPRDGYPIQHVEAWNGREVRVVHWAHGGGDEQPPFGPAWFYPVAGDDGRVLYYAEMYPQPTLWRTPDEPHHTSEETP